MTSPLSVNLAPKILDHCSQVDLGGFLGDWLMDHFSIKLPQLDLCQPVDVFERSFYQLTL